MVFSHGESEPMAFFGKYIEVTPHSRLVWTNDEGGEGGAVTTEKVGRVRTCKLGTRRFEAETAWLERYHQVWDSRFDELDEVVEEVKRKESIDGRKQRN